MVAFTFQYVLKFNLSVAIVCMVKPPSVYENQLENYTNFNHTVEDILNGTSGGDSFSQNGGPCGILESSRRGSSQLVTAYFFFFSNPKYKYWGAVQIYLELF